jgi:hypothetical protein
LNESEFCGPWRAPLPDLPRNVEIVFEV